VEFKYTRHILREGGREGESAREKEEEEEEKGGEVAALVRQGKNRV
jgi:hypothetical protein